MAARDLSPDADFARPLSIRTLEIISDEHE